MTAYVPVSRPNTFVVICIGLRLIMGYGVSLAHTTSIAIIGIVWEEDK